MKFKNIKLDRKQELDILINTSIEILKEVNESKLGLQLIKWTEERYKILLIELINTFFNEEYKMTTHSVVNGKAKKELIEAYREGEEIGYSNALDKMKEVQKKINNIKILGVTS